MTASPSSLTTHKLGPLNGQPPKKLVVLLHGYGTNGLDLLDLAHAFQPALPHTLFLSLDGPEPCEMAPAGRQWFSLRDYSPQGLLAGTKNAMTGLNAFLDTQLEKYGLGNADLALAGFSQGAMMSLYTGMRRSGPIAGILGYSGALPGDWELTEPHIHKTPVCLIHGEDDMVVPPMARAQAEAALTAAGFTVSGHLTPGLPHGIDSDGIEAGKAFLRDVLSE